MRYTNLFLLTLICSTFIGCGDSYYSSGKNPFDTSNNICEVDSNTYDQDVPPPKTFGIIGSAKNNTEYPRSYISSMYTSSNDKFLNIGGKYSSLCKTSNIHKLAFRIQNSQRDYKYIYKTIPPSYNGSWSIKLDFNKNEHDRCFYSYPNSHYYFYAWASDEDGNTFFANMQNKKITPNIKSNISYFNIYRNSQLLRLDYKIGGEFKINKINFRVYNRDGEVYRASKTTTKKKGSKNIYYTQSSIFNKTDTYSVQIDATEVLFACNRTVTTNTKALDKRIILKPTAKLSVDENATHILGFKLRYEKNYLSDITKKYFTIDYVEEELDEDISYYEHIREKTGFEKTVSYYVINDKGVKSDRVSEEY